MWRYGAKSRRTCWWTPIEIGLWTVGDAGVQKYWWVTELNPGEFLRSNKNTKLKLQNKRESLLDEYGSKWYLWIKTNAAKASWSWWWPSLKASLIFLRNIQTVRGYERNGNVWKLPPPPVLALLANIINSLSKNWSGKAVTPCKAWLLSALACPEGFTFRNSATGRCKKNCPLTIIAKEERPEVSAATRKLSDVVKNLQICQLGSSATAATVAGATWGWWAAWVYWPSVMAYGNGDGNFAR